MIELINRVESLSYEVFTQSNTLSASASNRFDDLTSALIYYESFDYIYYKNSNSIIIKLRFLFLFNLHIIDL